MMVNRRVALVVLGGFGVAGLKASDAYSVVRSERSAALDSASDAEGLLGITTFNPSGTYQESVALLELANQSHVRLDQITVSIQDSGSVDLVDLQYPDQLDVGEAGTVSATIDCNCDVTETVDVAIQVAGSDLAINGTRSVEVTVLQKPIWHSSDQTEASGLLKVGVSGLLDTTITVDGPSNVTAGDIILININTTSARVRSDGAPANFTRIHQESGGTTLPNIEAWYKIAEPADETQQTYSFELKDSDLLTADVEWRAIGGRISGQDDTSPIGDTTSGANGEGVSTGLTIPGITGLPSEPTLVVAALGLSASVDTITVPTGMTEQWLAANLLDVSEYAPGAGATQEWDTSETGDRTFDFSILASVGTVDAAGLLFYIE